MAFDPQKDARSRAVAQGAVATGNAFEGPVLPVGAGVADAAVFFEEVEGFEPQAHHRHDTDPRDDYRRAVVSVIVRGPTQDPDAARATAVLVYNALHETGIFVSADSASSYVDSVALRNAFSRLADDEEGHPLYSCDFLLQYIG